MSLLIKAYLKDCGFELDFAENGKIAVEKVIVRPSRSGADGSANARDGRTGGHSRHSPMGSGNACASDTHPRADGPRRCETAPGGAWRPVATSTLPSRSRSRLFWRRLPATSAEKFASLLRRVLKAGSKLPGERPARHRRDSGGRRFEGLHHCPPVGASIQRIGRRLRLSRNHPSRRGGGVGCHGRR